MGFATVREHHGTKSTTGPQKSNNLQNKKIKSREDGREPEAAELRRGERRRSGPANLSFPSCSLFLAAFLLCFRSSQSLQLSCVGFLAKLCLSSHVSDRCAETTRWYLPLLREIHLHCSAPTSTACVRTNIPMVISLSPVLLCVRFNSFPLLWERTCMYKSLCTSC